jgi:hypothetical protein
MKDMIGTEIEVGDVLVYTSDRGYPTLTVGTVVGVTENGATIRRCHTGNLYRGVKNGMLQKWVYNHETRKGEYISIPARNTTIGFPNRCLITKKASPL